MNLSTNLKIFTKFLSRNKLYTLVSVLGFAISLTFVILLGVYVKQELSVDNFHAHKEQIYLMSCKGKTYAAPMIADHVLAQLPEVESYTRLGATESIIQVSEMQKMEAKGLFADSTFFTMFNFPLLEGDKHTVLSTHTSIVLSEKLANTLFGNQSPVGKNVVIDSKDYLVTGVVKNFPANTLFKQPDYIANIHSITNYWGPEAMTSQGMANACLFLKTTKGTDIHTKEAALLAYFKENYAIYKVGLFDSVEFIPLPDAYFSVTRTAVWLTSHNDKSTIYTYLSIALLILVVASLNYINMTVSQTGMRGKEAAIKKLMGSNSRQLWLQQWGESVVMIVISLALAMLFAYLACSSFEQLLNCKIELNELWTAYGLLSIVGSVVVLATIASFVPAQILSRFRPIEVVKGTFRRKVKSGYGKVLVVFQYVVAISLIICSLFMVKQIHFMTNQNTQYDRESLLIFNNTVPAGKVEGLRNVIKNISGVENISFSNGIPYGSGSISSIPHRTGFLSFHEFRVDTAFFSIYNIQVQPTGIIPGEDSYWVNQSAFDALGIKDGSYIYRREDDSEKELKIAGIFPDFRINPMHQTEALMRIQERSPNTKPWNITIKLAANIDLFAKADEIERAYLAYNGGLPVTKKFMDEVIEGNYKKDKQTSSLISLFTLLTIIITIMGVFAMSLYQVQQKEKEIGIRKVNGATVGEILRMLNFASIKLLVIGFVLACPIAYYAVSKWLESFAVKISITPWIFVVALLAVSLLTLASMSVMTWRAARANPIDILKGE